MVTGRQTQIGNIDLVKQLNSAAVYQLIDQDGPISRIQIAEISQLAPASVTKITRQLIERGLIKEVEQQASTGGRRAISIVTVNEGFHTIAIRLGRKDTTLALFDLGGALLTEKHYPIPDDSVPALEQALFAAIDAFIIECEPVLQELIAISVILPGLVDPVQGIVRFMPHIGDTGWPLVRNLEARFKTACFVGHDIRSLALAEHYFGASRDCADSILVRIHRGTGAGIIVNGNIFYGSNGNVGEIGHVQVDPLGERCYCGNFGCLETLASNTAIVKRAQSLLAKGYPGELTADACTMADICTAANNGDPLAQNLIKDVGYHLGKALAMMINLFNPQKIVLAGDITGAESVLFPIIQRCIDTQVLNDFRRHLPVVRSQLDNRSAIGAFALAKRAMLNGLLLQHLLGE
ncbi:DNA-binding transcriptional regulator NagC [Tatumella ptyseos]|mgnify:CR=1 FL=1|uniref:DNA-binding transcriptional regulator NagC n=1 Tax=Tatumella ptyseos TaxID=82987 RepID=UPI0023F09FED|nr:ROK family protein [Tatumella ptyseos]